MPNKGEKRLARKRTPKKDIEILATLLVAYPEISRVVFEPVDRSLTLVFLCEGPLSRSKRAKIKEQYLESVEVYLMLTGKQASRIEATWEQLESFYAFQVERDVVSLSPGELSLTSDLISSLAKVVVASDGATVNDRDELSFSPRVFLQEVLDQVKNLESPRRLVALREGERVMVFDRQ